MKPITVLLVDDHILFREGLTSLLSGRPDIQVVGSAEDGLQAIEMARRLMPDLILMDVQMPHLDGIRATQQIKREMPDVRVVMLTMSEDDQDLFEAVKHGAQGYLLKNTPSDELVRFIESVFAGEAPISGLMAAKMLDEFRHPAETTGASLTGEQLTDRELQVLHCVADGLSNREIATALVISENTVKKHLRNILAKLHLQNRVQAALYARQQSGDQKA
jgi:two-component system, NarL family, nitrate/nitrite response regulator NarL